MRAARLAFTLIAGAVLFIALLLIVAPASVLRPAANYLLSGYGVEVAAIDRLRLGWRNSTAEQVRLRLPDMSLELQDIAVAYRLTDLMNAGRIQSFAVQQADLVLAAGESGSAGPTPLPALPTASTLLDLTESLPVDQFSLAALSISGDFAASAEMTVRARPLLIDAKLYPAAWPQWQSELQIRQGDTDQFNALVTVNEQARPVASAELALRWREDRYSLVIDSDIDLQAVQSMPLLSEFTEYVRVVDDSLLISAELVAPAGSTFESLSLDSLQLGTGDAVMNLEATLASGTVEAAIPTPLSMQGAVNLSAGRASVDLDAMQASIALGTELGNVEAAFSATDVLLDCGFSGECRGSLPAVLAVPNWQAGGLGGENATLAGELRFEGNSDVQQFSATELELQLARLSHELGSAELALAIEGLTVTAAQDLTASLSLTSRRLSVDLPGIEVINPAVSSSWSLDANRLSGSGTLSIDRELRVEFAASHDLVSQAGQVSLELEPLQISDARPLTRYVTLPDLEADIVAGSVAGTSSLTWQPSASGWQLSVPLSLELDGLSGFAADLLFVDFTTRLEARYQDGRLQSPGSLPATVATVDVGLPMNRIDWEYGFDLGIPVSAANGSPGTVTINGLRTAMLGGTVEIPEFVYDRAAQTNRLRVVLSRLELSEIVALANYPELQVEGTVSGYLPLLLGPEGIALEQGLVSALQPGGSIRYTPPATTAGNASVELLNEALSNYLFQTLNAELEYGENGDLEMAVQLRGSNPDMRGGQPINLNVSIANNIPEMLRSLQASRAISERLEQRLNRQ